jgi:hypothetical protein
MASERRALLKLLNSRKYHLRVEAAQKRKAQEQQERAFAAEIDQAWYDSNPPRTCIKCGETKRLYDFLKQQSGRYGGNVCRKCEQRKKHLQAKHRNQERRKLKPPWIPPTPLTAEEKRERDRRYKAKYRASYRADPMNRINRRISETVRRHFRAMKNSKPSGGWNQVVGYSLAELKAHIEAQFTEGMSWENYGEWHIDHIKPKAAFTFLSISDSEFLECWALSNLQPLWGEENVAKGATYPYERPSPVPEFFDILI